MYLRPAVLIRTTDFFHGSVWSHFKQRICQATGRSLDFIILLVKIANHRLVEHGWRPEQVRAGPGRRFRERNKFASHVCFVAASVCRNKWKETGAL
jgi:hypothetical protein